MSRFARMLSIWVFALCAVYGVGGCGWLMQPFRAPEYSFGFYNGTDAFLHDVCVEWGAPDARHSECAGIFSVHASKTSSDQPRPIPRVFTVTWRTPDGAQHRELVERKLMQHEATFHGTIWFDFSGNGVNVMANTYDEQMRLASDHKSYDH